MNAPQPPNPDPPADQGSPPDTALVVSDGCWIPADAMSVAFSRSSGPGGQAVNKVSSRVQLRVTIDRIQGLSARAAQRLRRQAGQRLTAADELLIQSDAHRSQLGNRRACESKLLEMVRAALVEPKRRKRTRPSKAMIERRLAEKRRRSEKKQRRRTDRSPGEM